MRLYLTSFVILVLVFCGQMIALHNLIIFRWPIFHVIMHVIGGIGIGFFIAALIRSFKPGLNNTKLAIICGTVVFGLIWEWFEAYYGLTGYNFGTKSYFIDTAKDLLNDMIGGIAASLLVVGKPMNISNK